MGTMKLLRQLRRENKISTQQFKTYKGQVIHGDEVGRIKGLKRNKLIQPKEAEALLLEYKFAYTE